MDSTVRFLAKNGISRNYNAGHVSFANNSADGGRLHTGGTIYAKVNGIENGSLQNIEYGLTITVKGGLVSPTKVRLDLDLVNSYLLGANEDSYNLSEDTTKQTVICELDKTMAIAGSQKIVQDTQKSGLPVLRNTPVLKWFVAEDSKQMSASRLLILVCPRIQDLSRSPQIEIPLDAETGTTYEEARRDAEEDLDAKGRREQGSKSWLDWFRW
jgi:type II secretory pathway component GspD/PulD (secretin)